MRNKNYVTLEVHKDLVPIYKASLDMYEALKIVDANLKSDDCTKILNGTQLIVKAALAKAEGK